MSQVKAVKVRFVSRLFNEVWLSHTLGLFAVIGALSVQVSAVAAQEHRVQVKEGGSCLNVRYAHETNGAQIIGYPCGIAPNETWLFNSVGNDAWEIIALHSGKCLDVAGPSHDNMTSVQQWECHGSPNQRWVRVNAGHSEWMMLRSEFSGKCLTFTYARDLGAYVAVQFDCVEGSTQLFRVI